jgi:hypothetical protein
MDHDQFITVVEQVAGVDLPAADSCSPARPGTQPGAQRMWLERFLDRVAEREGVSPEAAGGLGRPKPWYSAPQARQAQEVPHAREDPARRR